MPSWDVPAVAAPETENYAAPLVDFSAIANLPKDYYAGEVTYLGIDQKHRRVVLYPSDKAGLVYISYGVESMDAVMQNNYFVQERQIKIVHGPGREPTSGQIFVRFAGPEGCVFSYGFGLKDIDSSHRPRQFTAEASSLCEWGSECAEIAELQPALAR